ncbi:MAG: flippase [Frankiaceae bacterium]
MPANPAEAPAGPPQSTAVSRTGSTESHGTAGVSPDIAASTDPASGSPRTGRNIAALSSGQLLTWTMTLLWTFVVPRKIGPNSMGLIVSGWAVAGVLGTVLGLGTRNYLVREIVVDKSRAPRLIGTALVLRICLTPLFIAAVIAYTHQADYGTEGTLVVWLAAGATLLTLFADPLQAGFQALERMEYLAYSEVINKSAQGLLGVALALVGFRSVGLTACWLVAAGVVILANALWVRPLSRVELRTSPRRVGAMARHSLSYWAFGLFFMLYLWIDSIMLSLMTRPEVVGWYGVPTRLFQTMMFVPVIVSTAWLPRLVAAFTDGPEQLRRAARRPVELVLLLSLPIAAGTAVVAGPLIRLLYGPAYEQAVPVLVLLGLCIPFMYLNTMLGTVVIAAKRQIDWTWVMLGATLLNPLLNAALITVTEHHYHNGAIGAALSLLGTEVVMVAVGFAIVGRYVLDREMLRRFASTATASAVLALAGYAARPLGTVASFIAAGASFALVSFALRVVTPTEIAAAQSAARRALRRVPTLNRGRVRRASPVLTAESQQS